MGITCIIVEDQPPAQRVLRKYITDLGILDLKGVFADALGALKYLNQEQVDLVFLDVHLPKLSGIEFLKIINPRPKIILTTAFSEYALEGYELDIVDYLLKPFSFERFIKAVSKAIQSIQSGNDANGPSGQGDAPAPLTFNFVKSGNEYLNLDLNSILYIKSDGDYTMVHLPESHHLIAHPLRYWSEILPDAYFCQVHKSYIVNVNAIKKVSGSQISLADIIIPIGRTFKEIFFSKYLSG